MSFLKICFWNANGLNQHKTEVHNFIENNNVDVMLISETHLTNKYNFHVHGFTFYFTNHPDGKAHGGTGILIRNRIKHYELESFSKDYMQATSIHLEGPENVTISSIYCPPRFVVSKEKFEEFFTSLGDRFLACGDFNAKHTYWGSRIANPKGVQLYRTIIDRKNGLDFISPGQPTYWPTDPKKIPDLIDFGVSKNISRDSVSTEISYDLSSDHSPVLLNYYRYKNVPKYYIKTDWLKYKKYVSSHIVSNPAIQSETDLENSVQNFTSTMISALDHSKRQILAKPTTRISNAVIVKLLAEKRRCRREWQLNRSPATKQRLSAATKHLKRALAEEEEYVNTNFTQSLTNTKHTNFSLWKAAKNIKIPVEGQKPLRKTDGTWARNSEDKALLFAEHLSGVFQPNTPTNDFVLPQSDLSSNMHSEVISISQEEIQTVIKESINPKKAPGHDLVTPSMIINLPCVAIAVLTLIFNAILAFGVFPQCWKTSQIIMIPKPGKDPSLTSSYRPISLLPCLSKLFEKTLQKKILTMLNDSNIIPGHQFGFREHHGTIEQVNRITGEIRKAFELKKYCSAIFLDVAQAFDKVWHEGLIYKIKMFLPPNTHKLLQSYLSNRWFKVKYGEYMTNEYAIKAGVPQGSVLGPTLYLIYTSDLPTTENLSISTFADDTAILSSHSDPYVASRELDNYLRRLETWLQNWRIKVNELKSRHVTFALRRGNCHPVTLNNVIIPHSDHVKYLGIHLDRRLTWRHHIEAKRLHMKIKASNIHWLINEHSRLSLNCKVILYQTILKPIWTYGIELWGTASNSSIDLIQRAQSKILRTITGAPWYIRNENIHKDLEVAMVKKEFSKARERYFSKLQHHSNPLARALTRTQSRTRLRRADLPPC